MKKIFLGSLALGIMFIMASCSKSAESVSPSNNQKVLGLVVQTPSAQNSALILLKDGRAISPQSGFSPTNLNTGNKFVLSFEQLSTKGSIINVRVTDYKAANDSSFVPPPTKTDSAAAFRSAMQGTHHCTFTYSVTDSSHVADTTKIIKEFNIVVNGDAFQCNASYAPVPGGSGAFHFNGTQPDNLYFVNTAQLPSNSGLPPSALLSGQYYHMVFDRAVVIWTYTNATYSGFVVDR